MPRILSTDPHAAPYTEPGSVAAIGAGVLDRSLPKPAWTHAAHFAAALWLIRCRPDLPAMACMPDIIRAYNEATGVANTDTGGYHATITLASVAAAQDHAARHPALALHALANDLLAGPCGRPSWLGQYWSAPRLFSVPARRGWVGPDLSPLPFAVYLGACGHDGTTV